MIDKSIGPLQDAQRAIQLVRERGNAWDINPSRIGMVGLSAGGRLVFTEGAQLDRMVIDNKANISLRPDFMVLLYPLIVYDPAIARSRENLTGKPPMRRHLLHMELKIMLVQIRHQHSWFMR